MGNYCWLCERARPNERFSGTGHRRHFCRECARRPRRERDRIQTLRDITGFLTQRNISHKNKFYLRRVCESADDELRTLAALILEVARVTPGGRKRKQYLVRHEPDLSAQLVRHGLIEDQVEEFGRDFELDAEVWEQPSGPNEQPAAEAELPYDPEHVSSEGHEFEIPF